MTFRALSLSAATAAIVMTLPAAQAQAGQEAEAFVEANAQEIITLLQEFEDGERGMEELRTELRDKVIEIADVDRISNFVLGRYRRGADEGVLNEFREVFQEYAISVYERELGNYAGQTLEVEDSIERSENDIIVETVVSGGDGGDPVDVNWRVLNDGAEFKVVDVEVLGVWLAQNQREQITSIIGNAGGDIGEATRVLREQIDSGEALGEE